MSDLTAIATLQQQVWQGSIPLQIRLSPTECRTDESPLYLFHCPRLSYLPFLLPSLHVFFQTYFINAECSPHDGWFSFEETPLKWQHPIGLLYDLFSGSEPFDGSIGANTGSRSKRSWNLVVHFSTYPYEQLMQLDEAGRVQHDAYINSVKEADFLRNGTAKVIMSLSKDDSTKLWEAVKHHDLRAFNAIHQKLLHAGGNAIRHAPVKLYLPTALPSAIDTDMRAPVRGAVKMVQGLVPVHADGKPQTVGMALHTLLPTIFPALRSYIHALAVLHGAVLPLSTPMHELIRGAAYTDGFLHIAVVMVT